MNPFHTIHARLEPLSARAILDTQLQAAGLRQHSGPGPYWDYYQTALAVMVSLLGTPQAAGLTYEAGIHYIVEWLGC